MSDPDVEADRFFLTMLLAYLTFGLFLYFVMGSGLAGIALYAGAGFLIFIGACI